MGVAEHGLKSGNHLFVCDLANSGGDDPVVAEWIAQSSGYGVTPRISFLLLGFFAHAAGALELQVGRLPQRFDHIPNG